MDFSEWMEKVDTAMSGGIGLGASDMADAPYRDYFEDGMTPREAAACALADWNDVDADLLDAVGLGGLI